MKRLFFTLLILAACAAAQTNSRVNSLTTLQGAASGPALSGGFVNTNYFDYSTGSLGTGGFVNFTGDASSTTGYSVWLTNNAFFNGTNWIQPRGVGTSSTGLVISHHKEISCNTAAASGTNGAIITWTEFCHISRAGVLNMLTGYQIAGGAASGNVLRGNGTNFVSAQLASTDLSNSSSIVTLTGTQTLPNKTLASPVQGAACQGNCINTVPGYARAVSQTAAIAATTIFTTGAADTLYLAQLSVNCRSTSASATVTGNIIWTDVSGTVLTAPSSTATCTTLGLAAQGGETISIQAKAATNIQFSTSIANTPTYDVRVAISQPGTN